MSLFSDPDELERREKLKQLEDKREAFAQKLDRQGFKPQRMLFAQMPNGGFSAIARFNGLQWLIVSPGLGTDEDFILETSEHFPVYKQEVLIKSEGMGGMLGFGKKGEEGIEFVIARADGREARLPLIAGRNGWMEYSLAKNPLLKTQRRRSDANIVWDLHPLDRTGLERVLETVDGYFPKQ